MDSKEFVNRLDQACFSAEIQLPDGRSHTCHVYVDPEVDPQFGYSQAALDLLQSMTQSIFESGFIASSCGKGQIEVVFD